MNHQLTPLKKALELPRANLFIADDVGLGKTIEAGLVLQELLLRQRVELVLIVVPASVCSSGGRDAAAVRPALRDLRPRSSWPAGARSAASASTPGRPTPLHHLVPDAARPEYRDPLLARLGERARKSLLILDEAHAAAPAPASSRTPSTRASPRWSATRAALRAPPVPLGHPAQRPLQLLLGAARNPRPAALHPRRPPVRARAGHRHGAAPEGRPPHGPDDDAAEAADADAVAAASATLASPAGRAAELLAEMRSLAAQHATAPDAKVAALLDWIRAHQCPAVAVGGATGTKAERKWTDTRVIVFTEYGDTKRWLHQPVQTRSSRRSGGASG
jgi:hypothetical protein